MIFYRVDWNDADLGTLLHWAGNLKEAKRKAAEFEDASIRQYKIGNKKQDFVSWLNIHFDTDNG